MSIISRRAICRYVVVMSVLLGAAAANLAPTSAEADSWPSDPTDPRTPPTAAIDALPTAQIDGVAWQQLIVGTTVYVAGRFAKARPAGSAPGVDTVTRNNLLAYDLTTGALRTAFVPDLNAQALSLAASPDGSRIYVGGDFTKVNGVSRSRIAALDPTTGALLSTFNTRADGTVAAIAATATTVYLGGSFNAVGTVSRSRLAAVRASDGALLSWAPVAGTGSVKAMRLSPSADKLVVAGSFVTMNGSDRPGYGLAALDPQTGASLPWAVNNVVRDAGTQSAILSLGGDDTYVYGTGYVYGAGGNLEGAFAARWSDGAVRWVEDCHGDSYGVYAGPTAIYVAGHPHYCLNLGGYPEMAAGTAKRALAFSRAATGTLTADTRGYPSFTGQPSPTLQNFFPLLDQGSVSGQSQAAWAVAGSGDYVAYAGEFRNVNGAPQQGLVRFANRAAAPNRRGPQATGPDFTPTLASAGFGKVRVSWTANYDDDNSDLTYRVFRDGLSAPVATVTRSSTWWQRPALSVVEDDVAAGQHSYQVRAADPFGNAVTSPMATINATGAANRPPVASFTALVTGRKVTVDGTASTDPDGSVDGYAWSWGDGQSGTGATTSHSFVDDGSYRVSLTVTDDDGAQVSLTKTVVVGNGQGPVARDAFGRTLATGWGSADVGGAWTLNGSSALFSVAGGQGVLTVASAGSGPSAELAATSSVQADLTAKVTIDKRADAGGLYAGLVGRRVGAAEYRMRIKVAPDGAVTGNLSRLSGGTETLLSTQAITGLTYAAGDQLSMRFQVTGTSPTTLRARVWRTGSAEPANWAMTAGDSTAGLQSAGSVGLYVYVSGSATNGSWPFRFDDFVVQPL